MLSRRISLHSTRLRSVCFALLILLIPHSLFAYEVSNDFDTYDSSVETTLVWRYNLGELSTPLQIKDYVTNTSSTLSVNFSVGNGEDGIFDSSTYADFSEGGDVSGNTITINTDTFSTLQFTSFHLDSGWTIRPTGENPLSIYALGSVTIEGVIDCSGGDGEEFVDGGGSNSTGGVGVCGGGDGGSGASTISGEVAADGEFLGETVPGGGAGGVDGPTAGEAATGQTSGSAGGGGGAYTQTGASRDAEVGDTAGAGVGGLEGEVGEDNDFSYSGGGAGGGGGSAYTGGGAGVDASGGGGGAGGGVIEIHAYGDIEIHPGAGVYANGGDGGGSSSAGTYLSGGGGGGGGGSIKLFAGGEVYASGDIEADSGDGGDNGNSRAGGKGAEGRTWVVGDSGFSVALPPNALVPESPASLLADVGASRAQVGTFNWTSSVFDSLSTRPEFSNATITSSLAGASTVTLQVASAESEDDIASYSDISSLDGAQQRFLRYRVVVFNDSETDAATVSDASFEVTPFFQKDFEFGGGCGFVTGSAPGAGSLSLLAILFLLPLLLVGWLRTRAQF